MSDFDPVVITLLGIPLLLLYFLPSYVGRRKKMVLIIFLANLLLGWTIIGWIGVLYWAYTASFREVNLIFKCSKCGFKKGIPKKTKDFQCPLCNTSQKVKRKQEEVKESRFD